VLLSSVREIQSSVDYTGIVKFTGVVKDTIEKLESDDSKNDDHK